MDKILIGYFMTDCSIRITKSLNLQRDQIFDELNIADIIEFKMLSNLYDACNN